MNVTIDVLEPVERGKVVFEAIGPPKIGAAMQGRVSMAMRITNHGQTAVEISRIEIMGRVVSRFASPVVVNAESSFYFQNCAALDAFPLIIDEPFPEASTIAVFLRNATSPVEQVVPIAPHTNDGGPLTCPGKASDLLPNETWGASSNHPSHHQVLAMDMGIWGWDGDRWSDRYPGTDGSLREHFRVYGRPVYAMSDGTIGWASNDQPEHPTIRETPRGQSPIGNVVFVKSGREISLYAHLQPGSIPAELLITGAPVKRGQYLGKAGFSGDTSSPHLHVHVKKEPAYGAPRIDVEANGCDAGPFRPMAFKDLASLTRAEAQALAMRDQLDESRFTRLTNHSAPNDHALLYSPAEGYSFSKTVADSRQYIGIFREGDEIDLRVKAAGWARFTERWAELSDDSFRLVRIETFEEGNQRQFIGIFKRGGGKHFLCSVSGWDAFMAKWAELSSDGLRLLDVATHEEGGVRFFTGVFREGATTQFLWSVTGWDNFTRKWEELAERDLRVVAMTSHPVGGDRQYIGVFQEGSYRHALWSITGWRAFTRKWDALASTGLRLLDLTTFAVGDERQYIGVFRQGTGRHALASTAGYERFVQICEKHNGKGLRMVDVHVEQ